jgi:hypothetical protein
MWSPWSNIALAGPSAPHCNRPSINLCLLAGLGRLVTLLSAKAGHGWVPVLALGWLGPRGLLYRAMIDCERNQTIFTTLRVSG